MVENFKYSDLTQKIIGCAMTVHRTLGGANFTEVIYQRALMKELTGSGIKAKHEEELPVYYKDEIIGKKRLDILVEDKILIELKAVSKFEGYHYNQLVNYLQVFKIEVGLLLNFGAKSLEFKRFVNAKL
jgi:GxxExxY protein